MFVTVDLAWSRGCCERIDLLEGDVSIQSPPAGISSSSGIKFKPHSISSPEMLDGEMTKSSIKSRFSLDVGQIVNVGLF